MVKQKTQRKTYHRKRGRRKTQRKTYHRKRKRSHRRWIKRGGEKKVLEYDVIREVFLHLDEMYRILHSELNIDNIAEVLSRLQTILSPFNIKLDIDLILVTLQRRNDHKLDRLIRMDRDLKDKVREFDKKINMVLKGIGEFSGLVSSGDFKEKVDHFNQLKSKYIDAKRIKFKKEIDADVSSYLKETIMPILLHELYTSKTDEVRIEQFEAQITQHEADDTLFVPDDYGIYDKNPVELQRFIDYHTDKCNGESSKYAEMLLTATRYVSFKEYEQVLREQVIKLSVEIQGLQNICLLVSLNIHEINKSNYWIAQLVYYILKMEEGGPLFSGNIRIIWSIDFLQESDTCIFCDDASYSGTQLGFNVSAILRKTKTVRVIVPYVSNKAQSEFLSGVIYYYGQIMLSMNEVYPELQTTSFSDHFGHIDLIPVYFQFKIADYVSTYHYIYRCGVVSKKCPQPSPNIPFIDGCISYEGRDACMTLQSINAEDEYCLPTFYKFREFMPI